MRCISVNEGLEVVDYFINEVIDVDIVGEMVFCPMMFNEGTIFHSIPSHLDIVSKINRGLILNSEFVIRLHSILVRCESSQNDTEQCYFMCCSHDLIECENVFNINEFVNTGFTLNVR